MMKIGKFLYQERKKRNLTQKEFVKEVISVSQYSRVETGEQDLKTSDFFQILQLNKINIESFLEQNQLGLGMAEDEVLNQLAFAFYNRDLKKVKEIRKNAINEMLIIEAEVVEHVLKKTLDQLDKKVVDKLSQKLNESENWTTDKVFLQLFGSSMMLFDMDRLNVYMGKILKTYMIHIDQYSFKIQRRIGSICINYLGRSYKERDSRYLEEILKLLNNMSSIPELLMYKLLGKYFKALFKHDEKLINELLQVLRCAGYEKFIDNLPK